MRSIDRRLLLPPLALLALALAGCSVKAPPRQAWSLSGGRTEGSPALAAEGPALGLSRFTAASELRTTSLTWRDSDGHLVHETNDSWVDYPDRMLEEMTLARFLRAGSFRSVTMAPPADGLDAVLACRLVEFGEWNGANGRETRVTLRWQLSSVDGAILGSGEAAGSALAAEESMNGVVRAQRAASEQAIDSLRVQVLSALAR